MILNALVTCSWSAPPPTSRKFAGLAAVEVLDDVHRRHRQAGAVDQAADVAVERDVGEARASSLRARGSSSSRSRSSSHVGVAENGVVVEVDLGVERDELPVLGDDQRVDLDERAVLRDEALVEAAEEARPLPWSPRRGGRARRRARAPGTAGARSSGRSTRDDLLGVLGGDLLDLHAALGRRHERDARSRGRRPCRGRARARCRALLDADAHLLALRAGLVRDELHAEDLLRGGFRLGRRPCATFTPPPLPRPPAWICALTTKTAFLRSFCSSRRGLLGASRNSAPSSTSRPSGTRTPKRFSSCLAWYSWMFILGPFDSECGPGSMELTGDSPGMA